MFWSADGERPPRVLLRLARLEVEGVMGDPPFPGVVLEQGRHGEVGAEAEEIDDGRPDQLVVDRGPVLAAGDIAPGPLQPADELGLEVRPAGVPGELDGPGRVLDDLDGFDVGDVVEEPAVAGEDEHRVAG
jgi:hypothetical protein